MFSGSSQLGMTQGFGGSAATQPAEEAAKKARVDEKQSILPVTIRAIEQAIAASSDPNAELNFYGVKGDASQIIVVGVVERLTRQATSMEITLNDGTGRIKARYFISDEGTADPTVSIAEGSYVNAVGAVRMAPEVHLGLIALRPVRSADEVSYHPIECAHAALRLRKGPEAIAPMATQAVTQTAPTQQPVQPQPVKTVSAPTAVAVTAADPAALLAAVLEVIKAEAVGEVGASIGSILAAMASTPVKASELEIQKALICLVDSADCYNTVDDDHFLAI